MNWCGTPPGAGAGLPAATAASLLATAPDGPPAGYATARVLLPATQGRDPWPPAAIADGTTIAAATARPVTAPIAGARHLLRDAVCSWGADRSVSALFGAAPVAAGPVQGRRRC